MIFCFTSYLPLNFYKILYYKKIYRALLSLHIIYILNNNLCYNVVCVVDRSDIMKRILIFFLIFLIPLSTDALEIKSKNAILYNLNEDKVIYEMNSQEKISIASMTKIMTAIVAIENIENLDKKVKIDYNTIVALERQKDLNEKVVVNYEMIKGLKEQNAAVVGFEIGEEVTYYDLLYAMMLPSGADGAQGLAVSTYGSVDEFVSAMNKKAKELGLVNTHFANPTGLDDVENYSTVEDVSIILKYALKNEEFRKVFSSNTYTSSNKKHIFISTRVKSNFDTSFLDGSKTGFTYDAGLCLASTSHHDDVNYLLVTANAPYDNKLNHFNDAYTIYKYFFDNYSDKIILKYNEKITSITLPDGRVIDLYSDEEVKQYLSNSCNIEKSYNGINEITNNQLLNDKIGEYIIKCNDDILYQKDIYLSIVSTTSSNNNLYIVAIFVLFGAVIMFTGILFILRRRRYH